MLDDNQAAKIKQGVTGLETMTRFALAILALASGVYTYLGVRSLLDGPPFQIFLAAIIYSAAVSVGIYAFWSYLMRFVPLIEESARRLALYGTMVLGSLMIIAMSSWLNAAALAGSAALEQHLAVTLERYSGDLQKAHANALAAESLLPDVQRASERFRRLADEERRSGALTGTSGSGSVVQLLVQMGAQLDELAGSIGDSKERTAALFEEGQAHLVAMRRLVSSPGPVAPRSDEFAEQAVQLVGVISALEENSIAPSVKRAAADMSAGFIAPVADGSTADLAGRQVEVMSTVRESVEAQSQLLAASADDILAEEPVAATRFVPLSTAEAVIRYASDFAPSWAGAISIDLLPAVLVFILTIAHSAMRRGAAMLEPAEKITAAEMLRAVSLYKSMTEADRAAGEAEEAGRPEPDKQAATASEPRPAESGPKLLRPISPDQKQRIEDSR